MENNSIQALLLFLLLTNVLFLNAQDSIPIKTIYVSNEKEFVNALGDNTEIIIKADTLDFTQESLERLFGKKVNAIKSLKTKNNIDDTNTIDSLKKGAIFYKYNAFIGYKLIESEPYEFIELDEENNSTQIMIYSKFNKYYAILVTANGIVDNFDYNWEILQKRIVDIIFFDSKYEICWYLYDGNFPPKGRFGVGQNINQIKNINENFDCEIYKKHKIFSVDYDKGKIIELKNNNSIFYCSDGY